MRSTRRCKATPRLNGRRCATIGVGLASGGDVSNAALFGAFCLASFAGQQAVWGVAPALHSPLMAVTNAVSGLTALGGAALLDPSDPIPHTPAQFLGAFAVAVSAINIAGGFRVTDAMLQLFRREGDPEPPLSYFAAPVGLAAVATLGAAATDPTSVLPDVVAGAAATACVAGIGGLASQDTARYGNAAAVAGVGLAVVATFAHVIQASPGDLGGVLSLGALLAAGGAGGYVVAGGVGPAELPQTVAAFHSLVGIAAVATAVGEFLAHAEELGIGGGVAAVLAAVVGGVTFSGSIVAYAKLAGLTSSSPLAKNDLINGALLVGALGTGALAVSQGVTMAPALSCFWSAVGRPRLLPRVVDRRRGHARRYYGIQLLLGMGPGGGRRVAQGPDARQCRSIDRLLRRDPDQNHVRRDEPGRRRSGLGRQGRGAGRRG